MAKLNFKQRVKRSNLTAQEKAALTSLRQRNDIVIKPADKGGAVVVWARHLYIEETERQLSDNNFYQQINHDDTIENNNTVSQVVNEAISKGELPPSAVPTTKNSQAWEP